MDRIYLTLTFQMEISHGANSQSQLSELSLESVDVIVDINHTYRGDLDIVLQSPDGTESWLAVSNGDSNDDYSDWLFNTVHHWGESSLGLRH